MAGDLSPVRPRLQRLVPMLASNQDGEVMAAVAAITRTLSGAGLTWHDLAAALEGGGERIVYRDRVVYRDPPEEDDEPDWRSIAEFCAARVHKLGSKEAGFVQDMAIQMQYRTPTEKQGNWLASIYSRLKRAEGM